MKRGLKLQPKVKTKVSPALMYTGSTLIATGIVSAVCFFYFNIGNYEQASAMSGMVVASRESGIWKENGTWDRPSFPKKEGKVVIAPGHTVTVTSEAAYGGVVDVYGTLVIEEGVLKLGATSKINLHTGSKIISKGNGSTLKVAKTVWKGRDFEYITIPNVLTAAGALGTIPLETQVVGLEGIPNGENHVALSWQTTKEENNQLFEIQRSRDGKHFVRLAELEGAGMSQSLRDYQYVDKAPFPGKNYYRLRQVAFDGKYEYTKITQVDMGSVLFSITAVNEIKEENTLDIVFQADYGKVTVTLENKKDDAILHKEFIAKRGENHYHLDKRGLLHGMYTLSISQESGEETKSKKRYLFITE